jgi:hypothetical protein
VGVTRQVTRDYGEPESLLARDLGLDDKTLIAAMAALWQMSYSAKRDDLAGPAANTQKKGRAARQLKAELRATSVNAWGAMAVAEGFEPSDGGYPSHAFEACSLGRSDTPP